LAEAYDAYDDATLDDFAVDDMIDPDMLTDLAMNESV
jgi:hypothetical protein